MAYPSTGVGSVAFAATFPVDPCGSARRAREFCSTGGQKCANYNWTGTKVVVCEVVTEFDLRRTVREKKNGRRKTKRISTAISLPFDVDKFNIDKLVNCISPMGF